MDREKTTEMFLVAQGYEADRIARAIDCLSGDATDSAGEDQPVLTAKELCAVLKISQTTLWRHNPPHIVVGCRKRYELEKVKTFLSEREDRKAG